MRWQMLVVMALGLAIGCGGDESNGVGECRDVETLSGPREICETCRGGECHFPMAPEGCYAFNRDAGSGSRMEIFCPPEDWGPPAFCWRAEGLCEGREPRERDEPIWCYWLTDDVGTKDETKSYCAIAADCNPGVIDNPPCCGERPDLRPDGSSWSCDET